MHERKNMNEGRSIDKKEFEIPETLFSRDIENKVFQGIILHTLAGIDGISLVGGNFIDSILGRSSIESVKGISAEQDSKSSSVSIKIEVNICYGNSIPDKADEIQMKVREAITLLTGLHVASIHTVFKNVISGEQINKPALVPAAACANIPREINEAYNDEF